MFDFSHLPQNAVVSEYSFTSHGGDVNNRVKSYIWHKPPNAKLVFMLAIGGGGGGRGGGTSNSCSGGGGGGALTQAMFLAQTLPSNLIINFLALTNNAGAGGTVSTDGQQGARVSICNYSTAGVNFPVLQSIYVYAFSGGGGGLSTPGTGGGAANASYMDLANQAIYWSSVAGRAGTGAGTLTPADTSIGTALPILGGSGGGGLNVSFPNNVVFQGAGFTSEITGIIQSISGGPTTGVDASSGVRLPFLIVGGCGGGASNSSAGRGGNAGGYGAGGGGGGSRDPANGTGRGGDGGPAYACIIAW